MCKGGTRIYIGRGQIDVPFNPFPFLNPTIQPNPLKQSSMCVYICIVLIVYIHKNIEKIEKGTNHN